MQHKPTEEQAEVISAVAGRDSVMVSAGAGCTKSTTLEMAAPQIKLPALGLAFNKKIAVDLQPKMPSNFTIKTFNGFGHGAIMRAITSKIDLQERKLGKLVSQVAKDRKVELDSDQWDQCRQLVTKVMQAGITPGDIGRPLAADTLDNWKEIADDCWITPDSFEFLYEIARQVWIEGIQMVEKQGIISFDDQVYFPTCIRGSFPQYPVAFVDEAQDLSPLNHAMLRLGIRPDGKLVVVGDPKQAIYGFRGASTDSMERLRKLKQSWEDRPLLTTFRCPKVVVERQQRHVPGYRAWHTNAEGVFKKLRAGEQGFNLEEGWNWETIRAMLPHPQCTIGVICRNNAPLLSLAFKLIRNQVGVVMLGRDIGKGLITLSKKLLPDDATDKYKASAIIAEWIGNESTLATANGHPEKIASITDRGECLIAVLSSGCADVGQMRAMLSKLFARETGQVQLGTGHKWKGLEADFILILDPWRLPSKFAREAAKAGDTRQLEQEYNLKYVMETRTKHTLVTANLEDFSG